VQAETERHVADANLKSDSLLARSVVRRPLSAALLVGLALVPIMLPRGAHPAASWLTVGAGVIALGIWAMVRVGLVAVIVAAAIAAVLNAAPLRLDSTASYRSQSIVVLLFTVMIALFAFWMAKRLGVRAGPCV